MAMQQSDRQCMECLYRLLKITEKCISVTFVDFIHTVEYIVKLTLPPGSPITLVF